MARSILDHRYNALCSEHISMVARPLPYMLIAIVGAPNSCASIFLALGFVRLTQISLPLFVLWILNLRGKGKVLPSCIGFKVGNLVLLLLNLLE